MNKNTRRMFYGQGPRSCSFGSAGFGRQVRQPAQVVYNTFGSINNSCGTTGIEGYNTALNSLNFGSINMLQPRRRIQPTILQPRRVALQRVSPKRRVSLKRVSPRKVSSKRRSSRRKSYPPRNIKQCYAQCRARFPTGVKKGGRGVVGISNREFQRRQAENAARQQQRQDELIARWEAIAKMEEAEARKSMSRRSRRRSYKKKKSRKKKSKKKKSRKKKSKKVYHSKKGRYVMSRRKSGGKWKARRRYVD